MLSIDDDNRVVLPKTDKTSDYINASWINVSYINIELVITTPALLILSVTYRVLQVRKPMCHVKV